MSTYTHDQMVEHAANYLTSDQPDECPFVAELHNRAPIDYFQQLTEHEITHKTIYEIIAKAFHASTWTEKYGDQLRTAKQLASSLMDELNKGPIFNSPAEQDFTQFMLNRILCLAEGSLPIEAEKRKESGNTHLFTERLVRKSLRLDLQQHGYQLSSHQFAKLCLIVMPDMNYDSARLDADIQATDHDLLMFNNHMYAINTLYAQALAKYVIK